VSKMSSIAPTGLLKSGCSEPLPLIADAGASISLEFTKSDGAALRVRQPVSRRDLNCRRDVKNFAVEHYDKWIDYAHNFRGLDHLRPEELLFVTGVHKTAQFNAIAYSGSSGSLGLTLHLGSPGIAQTQLEVSCSRHLSMPPWIQCEVPLGNSCPDQCIFLRAFSVGKRSRRKSKSAAAVSSVKGTSMNAQRQPSSYLGTPRSSARTQSPLADEQCFPLDSPSPSSDSSSSFDLDLAMQPLPQPVCPLHYE
jgi:hypothetical protein